MLSDTLEPIDLNVQRETVEKWIRHVWGRIFYLLWYPVS